MNFHPEAFFTLLYYMAVGMLSIFLVMGFLILVTALLNKLTAGSGKQGT